MNDDNVKVQRGGGIGFVGLLTIVFIVLKLCGVIAWSWWWVLSPMLLVFALTLITFTVVLIVHLARD